MADIWSQASCTPHDMVKSSPWRQRVQGYRVTDRNSASKDSQSRLNANWLKELVTNGPTNWPGARRLDHVEPQYEPVLQGRIPSYSHGTEEKMAPMEMCNSNATQPASAAGCSRASRVAWPTTRLSSLRPIRSRCTQKPVQWHRGNLENGRSQAAM